MLRSSLSITSIFCFLTSCILILASCSKEYKPRLNALCNACLLDQQAQDRTSENCINQELDSTLYCHLVDVEDVLRLKDWETPWATMMCCNQTYSRYFHDGNENEIELIISDPRYGVYTAGRIETTPCQFLSDTLNRYLCIDYESATISCSVPDLDLEFAVTLQKEFYVESAGIRNGALLWAYTTEISDTTISIDQHFRVIVEPGSLDYSPPSNVEYFDSLSFYDQNYSQVYSYDNSFDTQAIKMFFNKDLGLISFIDHSGTQWVINDFE